ncbi:hypothetical protein MLD38_010731 [Melastoma candidum]|uniref:Uncharacterized protein n=1 Tax=Melastoma candidum TaxID=119954 RepID=A0ACB9R0B1_9MYRT|nr:hypothetical protein MLD38_010731 [Melastoma candidum]
MNNPPTSKRRSCALAATSSTCTRDGRICREYLSTFYAGLSGDAMIDEEDIVRTMISVMDEDRDGYVGYEEPRRRRGMSHGGRSTRGTRTSRRWELCSIVTLVRRIFCLNVELLKTILTQRRRHGHAL